MSTDEPQINERNSRIARRVAAKFALFECEACAAEIIKALGRGAGARVIRIFPSNGTEFVGLVETEVLISYNRIHVGVQVGNRVFDNLHHEGVPAEEWPGRFITPEGTPLIAEGKSVGDFFGARFRREQFREWVYGD